MTRKTRPPAPAAGPARTPAPRPNPVRAARAAQATAGKPADRYYARRPFSYGGRPLDREQVFAFSGQPNDERLVRLGYVAPVAGSVATCNVCGAEFRTPGARDAHASRRHAPKTSTRPAMAPRQPGESDFDFDQRREAFERAVVAQEDADEAAEEARLNREAPLNWENTQASRQEAGL